MNEYWTRICEIYETTKTPKEAATAILKELGYYNTIATLSAVVRKKKWDGRIRQSDFFLFKSDEEITLNLDRIHPAHIDQICDAVRKAVNGYGLLAVTPVPFYNDSDSEYWIEFTNGTKVTVEVKDRQVNITPISGSVSEEVQGYIMDIVQEV